MIEAFVKKHHVALILWESLPIKDDKVSQLKPKLCDIDHIATPDVKSRMNPVYQHSTFEGP